MSAIAGIFKFDDEFTSTECGKRLMSELQEYPADDVQEWYKKNVFLGCHAQWITPESIGEKLPFHDFTRQLAITADAIIDNRNELFDRLQVDYKDRKGMTDSELILFAYHKWGEECPKYLVGDFAFIIWDERNQLLFGARDFSGGRTLYFYHDQKRAALCTLIKPLFSLPYIEKKLNEQWLAEYLAISGMIDVVDAFITPYENIKQIPPAHSVTITRRKVKFSKYVSLDSVKKIKLKSTEEYVEAFQEVFQEAVTSRLRTNRKVGIQLSGGLDSGSIASFAGRILKKENKPLHTFSYIPPSDFEDFTPKNLMPDERILIKETVRHVGGITDHYLDFKGRDPFSEVEDFLEIMETPYKFFENSFWLKGMFEEGYREGVGVLLNGGRGNLSISWGSAMDYYALLFKRFKWLTLTYELNQYSKKVGGARMRRIPNVIRIAYPFIDRIFPSSTPYIFPRIINGDFAKRMGVFEKLKQHGIGESGWFAATNIYKQRKSHFEEVFHWNASNTIATKLSLKYSLWKRDPTNDIRVIRYCLSVPEEQYVQGGLDRALIRNATSNLLPDKIRLNQKIQGVQGADWVHRMLPNWSAFIEEIEKLSRDERALKFLDGEVIKKALLKAHGDVRAEHAIDFDYKILMRSLIVYRFIQKFI